jgi:hypothetical protein
MTKMHIYQINSVIFEYIIKMIKDDSDIDIYNITEEQYEDDIVQDMLNMAGWTGYPDIITEYFGNQSFFEPSLEALITMINFIQRARYERDVDPDECIEYNPVSPSSSVLRHYAYWYIVDMGYQEFLIKLKYHVDEDDEDYDE